jgi:UDP-N-acetylglucosamine 2-epimerase (non-hydrolysing)
MKNKIKILTIIGTRPEIIRLSRVIPLLDKFSNHILVHTGQNYDKNLDSIFFKNFKLRKPDYYLSARGSFGEQISIILKKIEKIIKEEKPDKFLVLGDTNSSLGSIMAKRMGVEVYHIEAGNRCFDDRVPEEVNRRIIDHSSDYLLTYTQRSCENLVSEGINRRKVFVVGNPIFEVINFYKKEIDESSILKKLNIKNKNYFLLTLHRSENTDDPIRLNNFLNAFELIHNKYKLNIIWPIHPRSLKNLKMNNLKIKKGIKLIKPIGFFDFIKLEQNSFCVITDSGTVQEECAIFDIPNITIRDSTERPETVEGGTNFITSDSQHLIENGIALSIKSNKNRCPLEYKYENVSLTIAKIILQNNI